MSVHLKLKPHLEPLVRRQRRFQLWCRLAACWAGAALLGLALFLLQRQSGWTSSLTLPLVALAGIAAAIIVVRRQRRRETDWRKLARQIEQRYPELNAALLTAVQQQPGKQDGLSYLQERLLREATLHSQRSDWAASFPASRVFLAKMAHLFALVCFGAVLWQLRVTGGPALFTHTAASGITVTPGDTSLERGTTLVVLARFNGSLPPNVDLVFGPAAGVRQRIPLVKSLADPVFGGSVSEVSTDLVYHVEFAGARTRDFKVTVFEHPRLERADADLTFPEYTGLPPKHIADTRRITAVEGSKLNLELQLNKPVVSAQLVTEGRDSQVVPLRVETNRPVATLAQLPLETSSRYVLQLVDADGRTNKSPARFVFAVLTNRTPELRLASPRGDTRPSPLEEIPFSGTVWDDFGVKAYGLAYTVVGEPTRFIQLGDDVPAKEKRSFKYLLRLEGLKVQPDRLVSWFVWADDVGPNGKVRRTPGDLYFAEIRPFDEIFREGQGMAGGSGQSGQSGQSGSPSGRLAELQKEIINATWNLQRQHPAAKESAPSGADESPAEPPHSQDQSSLDTRFENTGADLSRTSLAWGRNAELHSAVSPTCSRQGGVAEETGGTGGDLAGFNSAIRQISNLRYDDGAEAEPYLVVASQFAGQLAPGSVMGQYVPGSAGARGRTGSSANRPHTPSSSQYQDDAGVVLESQDQVLQRAKEARDRQQDPRAASLWDAAIQRMQEAVARLKQATNSPASLAEALTEEQSAYQALLRLQEHEYQVSRSRNARQGGGQGQQMQRQLNQMDLTQSENRYETQSQAQAPQSNQRREQLQIMNRLQELARRQQDLNSRLKELQAALQEARTEQEREDIRRRLKRLQEEEQRMLADVDELRQRMDRPENQSDMNQARQQLDQTRDEVQRAAEAAGRNDVSQALAAGTRAQRQLQQTRDEMRQQSSSQFAEDMRQMRNQARELAQQQDDLLKKLDQEAASERQSLSDSPERRDILDQVARQQERMTNLVDHATQISQQAETTEPLLSRQLYDTVRKFSQDSGKNVSEVQNDLLSRGMMTRDLYDQLRDPNRPDGAKLMDATSEMFRLGLLPQATDTAQRSRAGIEELKQGVDRAAESVLGDETESLRLAQQELDNLTDQLRQEIARESATSQTNQPAAGSAGQRASQTGDTRYARNPRAGQAQDSQTRNGQTGQDRTREQQANQENSRPGESQQANSQTGAGSQPNDQQTASAAGGRQPNEGTQPNNPQQPGQSSANGANGGRGERQTAQAGQGGRNPRDTARRGGMRSGSRLASNAGGGGDGGDISGSLNRNMDRLLDEAAAPQPGPITGDDFVNWSDRLRDVQDMIDQPDLRNQVATARERARVLRQEVVRDRKKPDWAVVRLQVVNPLVEVRNRIAEELLRRESKDALVPIDRDPVPNKYSDLVRRYYEELGKDK